MTGTPTPKATLIGLLGLTFVTGLIDAASVLGLGHVFVANMTGNVVFVGFAALGEGGSSLGAGLLALACFLFGALIGGRLTRSGSKGTVRSGFVLELVLLVLASGVSLALSHALYPLVALLALAMGLRNALVRKLSIPDMTTTVLTLTLTGIAADSSLAGGDNPRLGRRVASVAAMLSGAAAGALLFGAAAHWLIPIACLIEASAIAVLLRSLATA